MFDPATIIRRNSETFYDYRTGQRQPQRFRIVIEISAAVALTLLFQEKLQGLLSAVTAVEAIVLGFAFNVMFFLMSDPSHADRDGVSVEDKLRWQKVAVLKRELFYNIAYFIVVSMSCLLPAFLLLMPSGRGLLEAPLVIGHYTRALQVVRILEAIIFIAVLFIFYLSTIESAISFVRVVGRVNFLFERRREALEQ